MNADNGNWLNFVHLYLKRNAGSSLPGLIHNLNNYGHVLEMQMELLESKIQMQPETTISALAPKLKRFESSIRRLTENLQINGQRNFYTQTEKSAISIADFLQWLTEFWQNDPFFKHKVQMEMDIDPRTPSLEVIPFALTFCLEEALCNCISAGKLQNSQDYTPIKITVFCKDTGPCIKLQGPGQLPKDKNIWEKGVTTDPKALGLGLWLIRQLTENINWQAELYQHQDNTVFSLTIPSSKDCFKFQ